MKNINKQTLLGQLGKDQETTSPNANMNITKFSVATTNSYLPKGSNEWKHDTTWHDVVAFKVSDSVKAGLLKGTTVLVEGRTAKRTYDDKDGVKRYVTEIIADLIVPLGKQVSGNDTSAPAGGANIPEAGNTLDENEDLPF